jgi:hypothetical protein
MRHGLALAQCIYVTAGPKNKPVAVPCGLKYCHASDVFNDNGWGIDSKLYVDAMRVTTNSPQTQIHARAVLARHCRTAA